MSWNSKTTKSLEMMTFQGIRPFLLVQDTFRTQGILSFLLFLDTFALTSEKMTFARTHTDTDTSPLHDRGDHWVWKVSRNRKTTKSSPAKYSLETMEFKPNCLEFDFKTANLISKATSEASFHLNFSLLVINRTSGQKWNLGHEIYRMYFSSFVMQQYWLEIFWQNGLIVVRKAMPV